MGHKCSSGGLGDAGGPGHSDPTPSENILGFIVEQVPFFMANNKQHSFLLKTHLNSLLEAFL